MPKVIEAKPGLDQERFASLMQMSRADIRALMRELPFVSAGDSISMSRLAGRGVRYSYLEALAIEAARQLADDGGLSMENAMRIVGSGVANFFNSSDQNRSKVLSDFWVGVARARNSWGKEPRGAYPATSFGPSEYWSGAHFFGSLDRVFGELRYWQQHDEDAHPDSDSAAIFLSNISAADRRLRKRAAELGIRIDATIFAAD